MKERWLPLWHVRKRVSLGISLKYAYFFLAHSIGSALAERGKLNRPGLLLQLGFIPTPLTPASAPSLSPLGYMPGPATSLMLSPEGLSGSLRKAREASPRDRAGCSSEQVDYKSKGEQEAYVSYHFILLLILKYLLYPPHTALDRNAPRAQEGSTPTNGPAGRKTGLCGKSRRRASGAWQGNMLQAGAGERPPRGCSLS